MQTLPKEGRELVGGGGWSCQTQEGPVCGRKWAGKGQGGPTQVTESCWALKDKLVHKKFILKIQTVFTDLIVVIIWKFIHHYSM